MKHYRLTQWMQRGGVSRLSAFGVVSRGVGVVAALLMLSLAACEQKPQEAPEVRQWTDDLAFRIATKPLPPVAEGLTEYKIVVQDKKTGQPIETGQGRIFASHADLANTYDGLAKGEEVGTYYARIRFPVSGDWAVGLQFRRDSTQPLQRTNDWTQTVRPAPPLGSDTSR